MASGEEPYTISMLVRDYAAQHDISPDRFRITGTDIDRESMAFAQRAEYTDFAMGDIDPEVRERWFDFDGVYRLKPEARRNQRPILDRRNRTVTKNLSAPRSGFPPPRRRCSSGPTSGSRCAPTGTSPSAHFRQALPPIRTS